MIFEEIQNHVNEVINKIKTGRDIGIHVIYSAYEINFNEIICKGKAIFFRAYDYAWDYKDNGRDYESDIIENPTWLDAAICAKDFHHIFFENVRFVKEDKDIKYYRLEFGS